MILAFAHLAVSRLGTLSPQRPRSGRTRGEGGLSEAKGRVRGSAVR
jgi:hypothetical protein